MRLKPAVTVEQARDWLRDQVVRGWGEELEPATVRLIDRIAADLALISAVEIPEQFEPLSAALPCAPWGEPGSVAR